MHIALLIWGLAIGGLTTFLYRDWTKATTPGAMTRIVVMFVIGVIVPHCVTPFWHPELSGNGWPNYPDWFVASSVIIQILFFVAFGATAMARSSVRSAHAVA